MSAGIVAYRQKDGNWRGVWLPGQCACVPAFAPLIWSMVKDFTTEYIKKLVDDHPKGWITFGKDCICHDDPKWAILSGGDDYIVSSEELEWEQHYENTVYIVDGFKQTLAMFTVQEISEMRAESCIFDAKGCFIGIDQKKIAAMRKKRGGTEFGMLPICRELSFKEDEPDWHELSVRGDYYFKRKEIEDEVNEEGDEEASEQQDEE